jgi:hypothetical protein
MWTKYKEPIMQFMTEYVINPIKGYIAGGKENIYHEEDRAKYRSLVNNKKELEKEYNEKQIT